MFLLVQYIVAGVLFLFANMLKTYEEFEPICMEQVVLGTNHMVKVVFDSGQNIYKQFWFLMSSKDLNILNFL